VDRVPAALANEVRTRQQADVSSVPVYRGPEVGATARSRGARAFAAGGAVFLPDEAGSVDSPKARGLLAHELVHAVQQRTLGTRLPAVDSPLGQRLEAEAQAAERFYSGEAGAAEPPPLIHAPLPAPATEPEPDLSASAQLATTLAPAQATPQVTPQNLNSPFDAVTTAEVGKIATESAKHVVAEWTNPALQQRNAGQTGQAGSGQGAGHAAGGQAAGGAGHTPAPGAGGHAAGGAAGAGGTGTAPAFNAAARRDQLVAAAITAHNDRLPPGSTPVTDLSSDEHAAIDRQVAAEAAQHGVAAGSGEPAAPQYEKNSAAAWGHAITGMNMNYGFGERGWSAPVGSEQSWFGSETKPKGSLAERLSDQFGLTNADTATQFDTSTWYQPTEDADKDKKESTGDNTNQPAQHEDNLYGRANPDKSTVDVNKIDLDELATRIYDRLRSRLRLELLVDRERAGLLTDFR
jgi:hypothetical protein